MEEKNIQLLISYYRWSRLQINLALRAKFKCEYCDKDLFGNIDNYKLWEVDHIIPKSSNNLEIDYEHIDNKAITCRQCNVSFKSKYNPINEIGVGKSREEYIFVIRERISETRKQKQKELAEIIKVFF